MSLIRKPRLTAPSHFSREIIHQHRLHNEPMRNRMVGLLSSAWLLFALGFGSVFAGEVEKSGNEPKPPFKLSLEGLYHPEEKLDYVEPLPKTHWIGAKPSVLLLREGNRWDQVALGELPQSTQRRSEWPVFQTLCNRLGRLEGIDSAKLEKLVADAVPQLRESEDSILIRVDKALVVLSQSMPARYLSRDASAWKDATLDPTGRRLGYTLDGEMYVLEIASNLTRRLTHDGSPTLLDGRLDWTYQEEIFGRGNYRAFWFSEDSDWLAMMRVDTSDVPVSALPNSKSPRGEPILQRYSKAGDPIPHAKLMVWDLRRFGVQGVPPAHVIEASSAEDEKIFMGVWWHPLKRSLYYCVSDRKQSYREIRVAHVFDPVDGGLAGRPSSNARGFSPGTVLFQEQSPAWIEPPTAPAFLTDGGLVWRSELPSGRHRLYRVGAQGDLVYPITPDDFSVEDFFVSPDMSMVMVTGKPPALNGDASKAIGKRSVYRVRMGSDEGHRASSIVPLCAQPGWHEVRLSPDQEWVIDQFSAIDRAPELRVVKNDISDSRHVSLAAPKIEVGSRIVSPVFFSITTDDGVELPALLVRPEPASGRRFPVVIEVYGGPGLAIVRDRWTTQRILYRELLARQGIATLVVDNRSSGSDDTSLRWKIRGQFGQVEHADLMTVVGWLREQSWVDRDRLAIQGWSFGGFTTLYALTHSDAFVAGVAGGSVTDWKQYDSFYTERYMGSPGDNQAGYAESSIIKAAGNLNGQLLLIHGEADDNVHAAQSIRLGGAR